MGHQDQLLGAVHHHGAPWPFLLGHNTLGGVHLDEAGLGRGGGSLLTWLETCLQGVGRVDDLAAAGFAVALGQLHHLLEAEVGTGCPILNQHSQFGNPLVECGFFGYQLVSVQVGQLPQAHI